MDQRVGAPIEPRGRTVFLQVRDIATQKITKVAGTVFPDLDEDALRTLATCAVAGGGVRAARKAGLGRGRPRGVEE
ncbi:hypothetical protein ACRAWF_44795 [Streptomyces sp. L7]